jgi:hypothetical protein
MHNIHVCPRVCISLHSIVQYSVPFQLTIIFITIINPTEISFVTEYSLP